jgi:alpha-tubulin suppressor-like RCC1 family protein
MILTESSKVYTFGENGYGQLGINSYFNNIIPIRVLKGDYIGNSYLGDSASNPIIALGVGQLISFALAVDGLVYAFGYNGTSEYTVPTKTKDIQGTGYLDLITPLGYTVPANRITYNKAYLNCIINPETNETTYTSFEYGLTNSYGSTAIHPQSNTGGNNIFKSLAISNLIPGKTYHYRAIVYNSIDTVYGADRVFSTGANFSNTSSNALHSTYIGSDGLLYTFGSNDFGQLGDSNTTSTTTPHKVLKGAYNGTTYLGDNPANPIVAVAGAGRFTLVLAADGIVYTFGRNNYGQLGDNTTTNRLLPVKALKGNYSGTTYLGDNPANPIIYITAGLYNGMALAANGQVFGFGDNSIGQLGDGSNSQRNTAVSVVKGQEYDGTLNLGDNTSNPIISITSGDYHSMALAADGSVYSFGENDYGQLGNNTSSSNPGVIKVLKGLYPGLRYLGDNNLNPILSITAGQDHSATLAADGTVFTFGRNTNGQLGDTTIITRLTPVYALKGKYTGTKYLGDQISNPIKYIVAGSTHTMVLASNGIVYSFGNNAEGQLGTNASSACDSAVQVLKGTYNGTYSLGDNVANPIISISPLGRSGAALASNGSVYTFGYNGQGQLGDSTTINRTTAVQVKQIGGSGYIDLIGCSASNLLPTQPSTTYVGAYQDTTNGWTQYCDCTGKLLLSLKIGSSGAVIMPNEVSLKLGDSTTYSSNSYGGLVKNTNGYAIIDRRWNVSPTMQPTSSVGVKYYFRALEYSKLVSALGGLSSPSTITAITQLNMYKATNGSAYANPHTVNGMILYHDSLASDSTWTYANLGANHTAEFKVNSFSGGGGGGGAGGGSNAAPLPISLLNFDAQLQDKKVYITWSTLDEIGNDYFTIQKSINEINFTDVGQLKANSNSLTQTNYAMIDHNPSKGISYYRLKQTDLTGEFTYTNTKRICHLEQAYVSCYPNPTNGKLSVDLDEETNTYTFINLLGQEILSGRLTKLNNYIDISNCENGQYILFIKNSNQEVTKTLKISKY